MLHKNSEVMVSFKIINIVNITSNKIKTSYWNLQFQAKRRDDDIAIVDVKCKL